jgi:16S rRNA (adenine1518-N6/adenine1519-N6)-dimethyltransferase
VSDRGLLGARGLRQVLDRHGFRPTRTLGQNFVIDPNTIRKVVAAAQVGSDDVVLEIGAGAGSLTLGLARSVRRVIAMEADARLLPVLQETLEDVGNVEIVHGDALEENLDAFGACGMVANLPYNIATSVVLRTLEDAARIRAVTVMVQKEVGERLAAGPGSRIYGATSVMAAYWAVPEVVARISRTAFWPVPEVESVLVRAVRRGAYPEVDRTLLWRVIHAAFAQRRKTLRSTLASLAGSPEEAAELCLRAGVAPGARPEAVGLEGFVAIARGLTESGERSFG